MNIDNLTSNYSVIDDKSLIPCLLTFQRQYFSLYPPYLLTFPDSFLLASPGGQDFLLRHILGESVEADKLNVDQPTQRERWVKLYQPEKTYQIKVWKKIMICLEAGIKSAERLDNSEWVIDDRFYSHMAALMVASNPIALNSGPQTSYRTFLYDMPDAAFRETFGHDKPQNNARITLLEEQIAIQGGTTGLRTWTAALHLGHHILHHFSTIFASSHGPNRGFIELGAGTGFLSILLAQMGFKVVATDLGSPANQMGEQSEDGAPVTTPLGRLQSNIELNQYDVKPQSLHLNWYDARRPHDTDPSLETWNRIQRLHWDIVAADVIYDPDLVHPLVDSIDVLLSSGSEKLSAIISATIRNQGTFDLFIETCDKHSLIVDILNLPTMPPQAPTFWDSALDAGTRVLIMRITKEP
ncbi:hypothetical protein I305_01120 [Cryptococcus gattii E566]|uniref:Uncharacterized protein n=2 Tax=Cryptococcus gattii TaxID=37769 RepID=E6R0A5_CRYGW|nr:uncharacterized protein CGB_B2550W [Cryptococcus gattii WM276]ADV20239.1 Conserved hypothetical protein [Cryptococcus gattii WM276]KIR77312.1 hypothetical protein I306_05769 [Cryptococcus gattii EJB2]KIY36262.1 hypothetical protein I305_01120 [Cryptococcus gattii E566]KJE06087.1 hypothetical protein I311_00226 [Cryptococcus gattii NT-10]